MPVPTHGWLDRSTGASRWVLGAVVVVAAARMIMAVWSGLEYDRGDFYATMPGGYARTLNPTLWTSPDLAQSWAFGRDVYLYGPTQYLTLAPVVYAFDSYQALARFLLLAYGLLIAASGYVMWKAFGVAQPLSRRVGLAMLASMLMFFPLLQAYGQREFEVVILFLTCVAVFLVLRRQESAGAAVLGYITWFKFLPLAWIAYLAVRRWGRAVLAFAGMSLAVWALAYLFLGIAGFEGVRGIAADEFGKSAAANSLCPEWTPDLRGYAVVNHTLANVRWALCGFADRQPSFPAAAVYWGLLAAMGVAFAASFIRLERRELPVAVETWRRMLEAGLVITVSTVYFHGHYYYLIVLIIPLNALLARYLTTEQPPRARLALWAAAYVLLAAFLVPPTLATRVVGIDVWQVYLRYGLYFYGEVLLIALLLWEYGTLQVAPAARVRA